MWCTSTALIFSTLQYACVYFRFCMHSLQSGFAHSHLLIFTRRAIYLERYVVKQQLISQMQNAAGSVLIVVNIKQ